MSTQARRIITDTPLRISAASEPRAVLDSASRKKNAPPKASEVSRKTTAGSGTAPTEELARPSVSVTAIIRPVQTGIKNALRYSAIS